MEPAAVSLTVAAHAGLTFGKSAEQQMSAAARHEMPNETIRSSER
jgi:hypothetical protein